MVSVDVVRGIDQARLAKAEGEERRRRKAREAEQVKRAEEGSLLRIAFERLDQDYEAWVEKIVNAARSGAISARCAPFDEDFSPIVDRHHGKSGVSRPTWETPLDGRNKYSDLQYAYLAALRERLVKDGFLVETHNRVEDVPDYGLVKYCEIKVSGW